LSQVATKRVGGFSLGMGQRLGIAAALLGDPATLILDEPVNGLDPDGILWIRHLLRALAREGRTVFVSSHLMSEMALTADHLIVIGRGRLIADVSVSDFTKQAASDLVYLRSPDAERLRQLLVGPLVDVVAVAPGRLEISGMTSDQIGDLAAEHGIAIHELTPHQTSLEEAFMQLTHDSLEFQAPAGAAA
jgi:ABC-2 type transport system ATP-binding protein